PLADHDVGDLRATATWDAVVERLRERALTFSDRKIRELVPGLASWSTSRLVAPGVIRPLQARTFHCLQRNSKTTWGAVGESTLDELFELRNFGIGSAIDVLEACIRLGAHNGPAPTTEPADLEGREEHRPVYVRDENGAVHGAPLVLPDSRSANPLEAQPGES